MSRPSSERIGLVVIGRNEGARLTACLRSIPDAVETVVYVDSGSTDASVEEAKRQGVDVIELDDALPFSAARARNEGFERVLSIDPGLSAVQFVDGDCEIEDGWVESAARALTAGAAVVAVCGIRREKAPDRTPFNTICDVEWRVGSPGEAEAFGGDVLIDAEAFRDAGGYNPSIVAGEDPELALRLRQRGGRILRLDQVSTWHDAAMTTPRQWWQRARRSGHASAQVRDLHATDDERPFARETARAVVWGLVAPTLVAALVRTGGTRFLWALAAYPVLGLRVFRSTRSRGFTDREAGLWALSCTLSKFPEATGVIRYHLGQRANRAPEIIEYK